MRRNLGWIDARKQFYAGGAECSKDELGAEPSVIVRERQARNKSDHAEVVVSCANLPEEEVGYDIPLGWTNARDVVNVDAIHGLGLSDTNPLALPRLDEAAVWKQDAGMAVLAPCLESDQRRKDATSAKE